MDLIKREDAIEAIEFGITYAKMIDADGWTKPLFENENRELRKAIERIKNIPSAENKGEWIPCSERLPKPYVEVLVCDDYGWINLGAYRPCDVSEDCSGWSIHAHTKIGTEEVVAWMPLPEPWKGADDETN